MVDEEIPAEIRERARESWLQLRADRQNPKSAKPTGTRPAAQSGQPHPAVPATALNVEELYAMAIDAKLEVTLKFSTLPNARPAGQGKMAFALKVSDGQFVTVALPDKSWNKLVQANTDWPQWIAALTGTMGEHSEKGFTLAGPGLQIFEKRSKAGTATPVTDTPPAPSEPAIPPSAVPAAPVVTVVTKAGAATISKRPPLSLKR